MWDNLPQSIQFSRGQVTIAYSDIQNGIAGVVIDTSNAKVNWLEGNINLDPMFENQQSNNYRLSIGSPAIDAGIDFIVLDNDTLINLNPDDYNGTLPDMGAFEYEDPTNILEETKTPKQFVLHQNYPNPFNPSTTIKYQLPSNSKVKLQIYNLLGNEIATLVNKKQEAGIYSIKWNGVDNSGKIVPNGLYLLRIESDGLVQEKKLLLIK